MRQLTTDNERNPDHIFPKVMGVILGIVFGIACVLAGLLSVLYGILSYVVGQVAVVFTVQVSLLAQYTAEGVPLLRNIVSSPRDWLFQGDHLYFPYFCQPSCDATLPCAPPIAALAMRYFLKCTRVFGYAWLGVAIWHGFYVWYGSFALAALLVLYQGVAKQGIELVCPTSPDEVARELKLTADWLREQAEQRRNDI